MELLAHLTQLARLVLLQVGHGILQLSEVVGGASEARGADGADGAVVGGASEARGADGADGAEGAEGTEGIVAARKAPARKVFDEDESGKEVEPASFWPQLGGGPAVFCFDFDGTVLNNPAVNGVGLYDFWRPDRDLRADLRPDPTAPRRADDPKTASVSIWCVLLMVQCALLDADVAMITGHKETYTIPNSMVKEIFQTIYAASNKVAKRLGPVNPNREPSVPPEHLLVVPDSKAPDATSVGSGKPWVAAIDDTEFRRQQFAQGFADRGGPEDWYSTVIDPCEQTVRVRIPFWPFPEQLPGELPELVRLATSSVGVSLEAYQTASYGAFAVLARMRSTDQVEFTQVTQLQEHVVDALAELVLDLGFADPARNRFRELCRTGQVPLWLPSRIYED